MLRFSLFGYPRGQSRWVYVHRSQLDPAQLVEHRVEAAIGTRVTLRDGRRFVTKSPPAAVREALGVAPLPGEA